MAFSPYPAVYFEHKGERFKIIRAVVANESVEKGKIVQQGKKLLIGCADGTIEITEIQRQGKKAMTTEEMLRGYLFN